MGCGASSERARDVQPKREKRNAPPPPPPLSPLQQNAAPPPPPPPLPFQDPVVVRPPEAVAPNAGAALELPKFEPRRPPVLLDMPPNVVPHSPHHIVGKPRVARASSLSSVPQNNSSASPLSAANDVALGGGGGVVVGGTMGAEDGSGVPPETLTAISHYWLMNRTGGLRTNTHKKAAAEPFEPYAQQETEPYCEYGSPSEAVMHEVDRWAKKTFAKLPHAQQVHLQQQQQYANIFADPHGELLRSRQGHIRLFVLIEGETRPWHVLWLLLDGLSSEKITSACKTVLPRHDELTLLTKEPKPYQPLCDWREVQATAATSSSDGSNNSIISNSHNNNSVTHNKFVIVRLDDNSYKRLVALQVSWMEAAIAGDLEMLAAHAKEEPAIVRSVDVFGRTALHVAVSKADGRMALELLRLGVPVDAQDIQGRTCFHVVAKLGSDDVLAMLLAQLPAFTGDAQRATAVVACRDLDGFSALTLALFGLRQARRKSNVTRGHQYSSCASRLLRAAPKDLWPMFRGVDMNNCMLILALMSTVAHAVAENNADALRALLSTVGAGELDAAPLRHFRLLDGLSSIACVTRKGHVVENFLRFNVLHLAATQNCTELVAIILQHCNLEEFDIDAPTRSGDCAAFLAIRHGYNAILSLLLRYNSRVLELVNEQTGATALHCCFATRKAVNHCWPVVAAIPGFEGKMLCVAARDGTTPLHMAMRPTLKLSENSIVGLLKLAGPAAITTSSSATHKGDPLSLELYVLAVNTNMHTVLDWLNSNGCAQRKPNLWVSHPLFTLARKCNDLLLAAYLTEADVTSFSEAISGATRGGVLPEEEVVYSVLLEMLVGIDGHQRGIAMFTVLAQLPQFRRVLHRWATSSIRFTNEKKARYAFPMWRFLWAPSARFTSTLQQPSGLVSSPSKRRKQDNFCTRAALTMLKWLLSFHNDLLTGEEKSAVALSALRIALLFEFSDYDAATNIATTCLAVLALNDSKDRRAAPKTTTTTISATTRRFPDVRSLREHAALADPLFQQLAQVMKLTPESEFFLVGLAAGFYAFARRVLADHGSAALSAAARARILCVLDGAGGAQLASECGKWWTWDVVFLALSKGNDIAERRYPATEVLEVVLPLMPSTMLSPPPAACAPRLTLEVASKGRRARWPLTFVQSVVRSGFTSAFLKPSARVLTFYDALDCIAPSATTHTAETVRASVVLDLDSAFSAAVKTSEQYDMYTELLGGEPLLHFACRHRSTGCFSYLLRWTDVSQLTATHKGLHVWDICAALLWTFGTEQLVMRGLSVAGSASQFTSLFKSAFASSLTFYAQMGFAREVRVRSLVCGSPEVFLRTVRFLHRPEIASQWASTQEPRVVSEALLTVCDRHPLLSVVRVFAESGGDVDFQRIVGATPSPLHVACRRGHATVVAFLLSRGAKPDVTILAGDVTPLMEAKAQMHNESVNQFTTTTTTSGGQDTLAISSTATPSDDQSHQFIHAWYDEQQKLHDNFASPSLAVNPLTLVLMSRLCAVVCGALGAAPSEPPEIVELKPDEQNQYIVVLPPQQL